MNDPVQMLIAAGAIPTSPFAAHSRYDGVPLTVVASADGTPQPVLLRRFIPMPGPPAARYRVAAGDRVELIAARQLGDAQAWWRIADANRVIDPFSLTDTPGARLDLPRDGGR